MREAGHLRGWLTGTHASDSRHSLGDISHHTNEREEVMEVIVINNDGEQVAYGYSPEHYAGVNLFYARLLNDGEIKEYTITKGGN